MYGEHYSVLNKEVMDHFNLVHSQNPVFLDLTFGAGGHSLGILKTISHSKVIAVDQDREAINNAEKIIKEFNYEDRLKIHKMNFEEYPIWHRENLGQDFRYDGIVMDIGVSSHQFDQGVRGMSFRFESELDMRMDQELPEERKASFIINNYSLNDLEGIFKEYGEEKYSKRIATRIIELRADKDVKNTKELEDIIFHCYPKKERFGKTHPATKVFQALRIYVNRELEVLESVIKPLFSLLKSPGIFSIISFHSLEDRIVKHQFKSLWENSKDRVKIFTKRPITASFEELEQNPRSRSAKLRILGKGFIDEKQEKKKRYKSLANKAIHKK